MARNLITLLLLVVLSTSCTLNVSPVEAAASPGVVVEYFNSVTLTGLPAVVQVEDDINLHLDTDVYPPAQGIGSDFSARWSGFITAPATDSYGFTVTADDGVRFTLGGTVLVDDWSAPTLSAHETSLVNLTGGQSYPFTLEFFDANGSAVTHLSWHTATLPDQTVPASAFTYSGPLPKALPAGKRAENEICIPDLSDPDAQYSAGTPIPPDVAVPGTLADMQNVQLAASNISNAFQPNTYTVIVVPVGYTPEQIATQVKDRVDLLQNVVNQLGMRASYAYINTPVPAQVLRYGDLLRLDEQILREVLNKAYAVSGAHLVVIDVNTSGRGFSSWLDNRPYNIVTAEGYLYSNVHELAHALGLADGYVDSTYSYGEFLFGGSTELFLVDANGIPMIRDTAFASWIAANQPEFEDAGVVCLGDRLVRMVGEEESIMNAYWTDDEVIANGLVNPAIFTDFQRWVIQTTTDQLLGTP